MTPVFRSFALALTACGLLAGHAHAACQLERLLEIPVTMTNQRPLVAAKVNGRDAVFIADSGAFFSQMSPAKAKELGLKPGPAPIGLTIEGVGGVEQKIGFVTTKSFSIAGQNVAGAFIVGGGEPGEDTAGVIGQNILGYADVEYDLAHGVIRLMRPHDCVTHALAYWTPGPNYSTVGIMAVSGRKTYGSAYVNGARMRVLFDTGAAVSVLTLAAAKSAGLDPHGAGVIPAGVVEGFGRRQVATWIAPVTSFKIGDEDIHNTRLRFADMDSQEYDILLGADFFLSHRVYVANDQAKLYFTYNGGPVFNLDVVPAGAAAPAVASGATSGDQPADAAGFAARGAAFASRQEFDKAIADLTKAINLAPDNPTYLFERARAYQGNKQPFRAMADLDKSLTLKPDDIPALVTRAAFLLAARDKPHALADLAAADRLAAREADVRLTLAELYERADDPTAAIAQLDLWIAAHPEDSRQVNALSQRCLTRALWNQGLDLALADCNAALKRDPKRVAIRANRGLVWLRQGDAAAAAADFGAVLAVEPKDPLALYGRGLSRTKMGQTAEGKADIAAAVALRPGLDAEAKAHGLTP